MYLYTCIRAKQPETGFELEAANQGETDLAMKARRWPDNAKRSSGWRRPTRRDQPRDEGAARPNNPKQKFELAAAKQSETNLAMKSRAIYVCMYTHD